VGKQLQGEVIFVGGRDPGDTIYAQRYIEILKSLMSPSHSPYELLAASERDSIVASHLEKYFPPLGLASIGPRTWLDESRPPIKRMFDLILVKGAGMRARWGFSLDFVPHISSGRVRWHRSEKSAMLDVIVDPGKNRLPGASFIHGAARLHQDLDGLLPTAVKRAKETWLRGEDDAQLLDLVREIREGETNYLPFDNYTQLPLAYAFLSARLGDFASSEAELDRYASRSAIKGKAASKLKEMARLCSLKVKDREG